MIIVSQKKQYHKRDEIIVSQKRHLQFVHELNDDKKEKRLEMVHGWKGREKIFLFVGRWSLVVGRWSLENFL